MTRRPHCIKRPWATRDLAEGHRLLLEAQGKAHPGRLHAYKCEVCLDTWHVGHWTRRTDVDD